MWILEELMELLLLLGPECVREKKVNRYLRGVIFVGLLGIFLLWIVVLAVAAVFSAAAFSEGNWKLGSLGACLFILLAAGVWGFFLRPVLKRRPRHDAGGKKENVRIKRGRINKN